MRILLVTLVLTLFLGCGWNSRQALIGPLEACSDRAQAYFNRCPRFQKDGFCGAIEDAYRAYSCLGAIDVAVMCYEGKEAEAREKYHLGEKWKCPKK